LLRWLYKNIAFAILAPIIGGLLFHGLASVAHVATGGALNYSKASEKRQQAYLESVAAGFAKGFTMVPGEAVAIEHVKASADDDELQFDARFTNQGLDRAPFSQNGQLRDNFLTIGCAALSMQNILGQGVDIIATLKRPSGQSFARIHLNEAACANYL